ncbi:hypothetical protein [Flavobacterium sp.]|uniref:hypothetical protein n=1 Tax=Flavobacterium sp. TaxID=239 RepID=UPI003D105B57
MRIKCISQEEMAQQVNVPKSPFGGPEKCEVQNEIKNGSYFISDKTQKSLTIKSGFSL